MKPTILMSVPNVSEGRDEETIAAIARAFLLDAGGPTAGRGRVRLLDVHSDRDHHRSVYTLAAGQGELGESVLAGARVAVERIEVVERAGAGPDGHGQHPHVGAIDVVPLVYLRPRDRGAACAEALVLADRIGAELEVPVFLYGELSGEEPSTWRTRAELRRGGVNGLAARIADAADPLRPDFGPAELHRTAGATLLGARAPLVAFNVRLAAPAGIADARRVAALIREGGEEALAGVRALGIELEGGVAQVSTNIEQPFEVPLVAVLEVVRRHADVDGAELVGLAPAAALEGYPPDVPIDGFDPARHVIENALGC